MSKKRTLKECPVCERGVGSDESDVAKTILENLGEAVDEGTGDEFGETPTDDTPVEGELSDLEELEALITTLEEQAKGGFNLWLLDRIEKLKAFADGDNFDAEGNRLDNKVPAREEVLHQISPPEAVELDGWWEAPMGEVGNLSRSMVKELKNLGFRNEIAFKKETLGISKARSNGAFVIRNQRETANYFLAHPEEAARKTGTTTRIINMMGHALDQFSYMLPAFDFYGASKNKALGNGVGHFALDPEVPFTEEEKELYRWMGTLAQSSGFGPTIAGAKHWLQPVITNPKEVIQGGYENGVRKVKGVHVAQPNYHRMFWVINHPWWVMPRLVMNYNTAQFKYSLWRTMCFKANRIDAGVAAPVPGWVPRSEIDSDLTDTRSNEWDERHGENTAADSKTKPIFVAGSELERDGTPKEYGHD